jgi:hypothetical protein
MQNVPEDTMTEVPVQNEPVDAQETSKEGTAEPMNDSTKERTWKEEVEIAGNQLIDRIKELIAEGNVRRLILRTQDDKTILEIPLTAGAVVGGVVTIIAPLLAALGALAALVARVKVQIVRSEDGTDKTE